MDEAAKREQAARTARWGLCAACVHARVIVNDRGSAFVQCSLAKTDPAFRKYPPLPVRQCAGFVVRETVAGTSDVSTAQRAVKI